MVVNPMTAAVMLLSVLNKVVEAKQDDGRINAGEVLEIIVSAFGSGLGIDPGKLKAWIQATENLLGQDILTRRIGILKD